MIGPYLYEPSGNGKNTGPTTRPFYFRMVSDHLVSPLSSFLILRVMNTSFIAHWQLQFFHLQYLKIETNTAKFFQVFSLNWEKAVSVFSGHCPPYITPLNPQCGRRTIPQFHSWSERSLFVINRQTVSAVDEISPKITPCYVFFILLITFPIP